VIKANDISWNLKDAVLSLIRLEKDIPMNEVELIILEKYLKSYQINLRNILETVNK